MKERSFGNPYSRNSFEPGSEDDEEYQPRGYGAKDRNGRRALQTSAAKGQVGRSRPTNHQLL